MVTVNVTLDKDGKAIAFKASGHATHGTPGNNIVCAGISTLTWAAYSTLMNYLDTSIVAKGKDGFMDVSLISEPSEQTETVFKMMILGLQAIENDFPDKLKVMVN